MSDVFVGDRETKPAAQQRKTTLMSGFAIKEVTEQSFEAEVLGHDKPVLVCFTANQAGMGDVTRRIAEGVARSRNGSARVVVVDIDKAPKTARQYTVLTTPTYVLFRGGRKLVTAVGYQRESDIQKLLDRFLEADAQK